MPDYVTHSEFGRLEERVDTLEGEMSTVSALRDTADDLRSVIETLGPLKVAFENAQGGLRVLEVIGRIARPIVAIVAAAGVIWGLIHGGSKP